ncbi:DUF47 family protein [Candidatus Undinarchaeota archaeon]
MGLLNYTDENEVYDLLSQQMERVRATVKKHYEVVDAFYNKDFDVIERKTKETLHLEDIVDSTKADIRRVLSENPFVPSFRQDALALVMKIEDCADSAEASAKFFWISSDLLKRKYSKIPKKIKDNMLALAKYGVEISEETQKGVDMLKGKLEDIEAHAAKVGKMEDDADNIEDDTLKMIIDSRLDDLLSIELIASVRLLADVTARCNSATHILTYMRIAKI